MYCPICKNKNNENSKYCSKCGALLNDDFYMDEKQEKKINTLDMIGFVLAFIFPLIGLIISIIGVIVSYKYIKKSDTTIRNLRFGIAGIILSIFFIIIYTAVILIILKFPINRYDIYIYGKYNCIGRTLILSDNKLKTTVDDKEVTIGSYKVNKIKIERNNCIEYGFKLNINDTLSKKDLSILDAKKMLIRRCNNITLITFDNNRSYICTKE